MIDQDPIAWGAYGLRITGLQNGRLHLHKVPGDWAELRIELCPAPTGAIEPAGTLRLDDDRAEVWVPGPGRIELLREPLALRLHVARPPAEAAIVHPFLGLPAAIIARWQGRAALHGGAFSVGEHAWALLGDREAGKSTLLGQLLNVGTNILCDDIVICEPNLLYAGPRSVDLRADASVLIGGEELGVVGNRPRWRLRPPAGPAVLPLGGLVKLEWGEPARMEPLDSQSRLDLLIGSSALRPINREAETLLDLMAIPAWRFIRPRQLDQLERVSRLLLAELDRAR